MKKFTLLAIAALISVVAFAQKPKQILRNAVPIAQSGYVQALKSVSEAQAQVLLAKQAKTKRVPAKVEADPDYATVTLTAGDVWGDGSGYQLLLDADATACAAIQTDLADVPYEDYEYKIPENADFSPETSNVVFESSVTIKIPAGTYDYVVTNPWPGDRVYIAGNGLGDDYVFEKGKVYDFTVALSGQGDAVTVAVDGEEIVPEGPSVVTLPEGVETEEYAINYQNSQGAAASGSVNVAIVGADVYISGLSTYLPDAFVKGTLENNVLTIPANQYLGNYAGLIDIYFLPTDFGAKDAVFSYDPATSTFTSEDTLFGVYGYNGKYYYDGYFDKPVIKKVTEFAATPANPAITALTESTQGYGWYITFNVPNVDADGNGLVGSKLSYVIYTDVEHEVSPLTFTPATHTNLKENMTEIPFGFTEQYDFYATQIYLNGLYSADWNKIGIKSIYRGGGEVNETEIQWFDIKDYAPELADGQVKATWVAAEQGYENAEFVYSFDIDNNISVTLEKNESSTDPAYYNIGSALRIYDENSFTVIAGSAVKSIDKIVLNYVSATYNGYITTDVDTYTVAGATGTWEGEANDVTFINDKESAAAETNKQARIQSIDVYYTLADQGEEPVEQSGITVDPAEGNVESLSTVTVTFNDIYVEIIGDEDDARAELFNTETEEVVAEAPIYEVGGNKLIIVFSEEVTEPGDYLLIIPDGTLRDSRTEEPIGDLDFHYTIGGAEEPAELTSYTFGFEDGTLQGWTTIDADGDGHDWAVTPASLGGLNSSAFGVFSQSYDNEEGALTPDNFLVSPKVNLDGSITFYAAAQDASYPAEHFGVFVSTAGNESADDFTVVDEWTLTAARALKAPRKVRGNVYEYTVDLSSYAGQEGYVAIRHFDSTDEFYIVVDNITLKTSTVLDAPLTPDYTITPAEGEVKSLESFTIAFSNFTVAETDDAAAILFNTETEDEVEGSVFASGDGRNVFVTLTEEVTAPGAYELIILDGSLKKDIDDTFLPELTFYYTIAEPAAPAELVEVPEGVEIQTWTLEGTYATNSGSSAVQQATGVAIDGNDIYVQGLAYYFGEAWIKGTIEGNVATFPAWQFVGEDEYGQEYLLGSSDGQTAEDIIFAYDADAQTLTLQNFILENDGNEEIGYWGYWSSGVLYAGEPEVLEPVTAPADLATETYIFKAQVLEYGYEDDGFQDYQIQVEVGFDGDDLYIQGIAQDVPELWVKATKNAEGQYVIPANQYMGDLSFWGYTFPYFFTATDGTNALLDVVLSYDAETQTFSTDQWLALNGAKNALDYYLLYQDVTITKFIEVAATPADPEVLAFNQDSSYPNVQFDIPAVGTNGEALNVKKLFYIIWIEKDGEQQQLTLTADLYPDDLTEDVTEIPYNHDVYDIYAGGSRVYLNQADVADWTKIGVQSVYYGADEKHESNIVWNDGSLTTGISSIAAASDASARYFDLQGRAADKTRKGLLIMQTADGKTVKVVRK